MSYGPRREKKAFEPPPWEEWPDPRAAQEDAPREDGILTAQVQAPPGAPGDEADAKPAPDATKAPPAEVPPAFDGMLHSLAAEERVSTARFDTLGSWAGVSVGVFGVVMFVWGVVAVVRGGGGLLAFSLAAALMAVGGVFAGAGAWLAHKSLKRQGVL